MVESETVGGTWKWKVNTCIKEETRGGLCFALLLLLWCTIGYDKLDLLTLFVTVCVLFFFLSIEILMRKDQ